jgi:hypothetical protein
MIENLHTPDSIRTVTGRYVNVFAPQPHMFCIEDIAHALAHQPRFGGHLPRWYSVGMHVLNVMDCVQGEFKFDALMHDCSEAYLTDMPSPIKARMPEYKAIEDSLMRYLSKGFGFRWPLPETVKQADGAMLRNEWRSVMLGLGDIAYGHLTNAQVKREIMGRYHRLAEDIQNTELPTFP